MRITATVNGERIEADDVREGENLLFVLRCEQRLRTGPSHSPTATETANQATRPVGTHHHAFMVHLPA